MTDTHPTQSTKYLWLELSVLFVLAPTLLLAPLHPVVIIAMVLVALAYCVYLGVQSQLFTKAALLRVPWQHLTRGTVQRYLAFLIISTGLVAYFQPQSLFQVVLLNPVLWVVISLVYTVLSVYPQEWIYRHFFFARYRRLFSNNSLLFFVNALLFCFAHLVFLNTLVFALTFIGGWLFARTYQRSQSLMLTSMEHAAYGWWLFTLGIGDMLAFPGP